VTAPAPALRLVSGPLAAPDPSRPEIAIPVDRLTLAKRLWRGVADDGVEFGFELAQPLRHGDTVLEGPSSRYVIRQREEAVVEIPLEMPPCAAAAVGWAIGNLHLQLASEPARLLAADEPAIRQLLDRLQVPYRPGRTVFRPGRFSRGARSHDELGPGHRH
jgi:urease accessory protein